MSNSDKKIQKKIQAQTNKNKERKDLGLQPECSLKQFKLQLRIKFMCSQPQNTKAV